MEAETAQAYILSHRHVLPSGCWEWSGYKTHLGYGETILRGKKWRVHRLSYTAFKGEIPDGMHVCHSCDFRPCVNPDHLWIGTHLDNQRDAGRKGRMVRTHCPKGHEYAIHGKPKSGGGRSCAVCDLAKCRIRTGWPADLAYSMPPGQIGYRPPEAGPVSIQPPKPRSKTHCKRGHPYTPESTYINPDGRRRCKICQLAAQYRRVYVPEENRPSVPYANDPAYLKDAEGRN